MNRYFEDTGYHLYQAGRNARKGLEQTSDSVSERIGRLVGREPEPDPSPIEAFAEEVENLRGEFLEARDRLERVAEIDNKNRVTLKPRAGIRCAAGW
ncbi:MAG: hypothetical protein U5K37_03585 [Natrialbaceae archaeon]|nr:hypothetical protein [Natrialbaceae archaeon]